MPLATRLRTQVLGRCRTIDQGSQRRSGFGEAITIYRGFDMAQPDGQHLTSHSTEGTTSSQWMEARVPHPLGYRFDESPISRNWNYMSLLLWFL